jgi:hypothetical protein
MCFEQMHPSRFQPKTLQKHIDGLITTALQDFINKQKKLIYCVWHEIV